MPNQIQNIEVVCVNCSRTIPPGEEFYHRYLPKPGFWCEECDWAQADAEEADARDER